MSFNSLVLTLSTQRSLSIDLSELTLTPPSGSVVLEASSTYPPAAVYVVEAAIDLRLLAAEGWVGAATAAASGR